MERGAEHIPQPYFPEHDFRRATWIMPPLPPQEKIISPEQERANYDQVLSIMQATETTELMLNALSAHRPLFLRDLWDEKQEALKQNIKRSKIELCDVLIKIDGMPVRLDFEDGQGIEGRVVMHPDSLQSSDWQLVFKSNPDDDGVRISQTSQQLRQGFLAAVTAEEV